MSPPNTREQGAGLTGALFARLLFGHFWIPLVWRR